MRVDIKKIKLKAQTLTDQTVSVNIPDFSRSGLKEYWLSSNHGLLEFRPQNQISLVLERIISATINQPYFEESWRCFLCDSTRINVYRANYDASHALRQYVYMTYLLHYIQTNSNEACTTFIRSLTKEQIACLQLAAFCSHAGRTNEISSKNDPTNNERSAEIFRHIAISLGFDKKLVHSISHFIEHYYVEVNKEKLTTEQTVYNALLQISHNMDMVRLWEAKQVIKEISPWLRAMGVQREEKIGRRLCEIAISLGRMTNTVNREHPSSTKRFTKGYCVKCPGDVIDNLIRNLKCSDNEFNLSAAIGNQKSVEEILHLLECGEDPTGNENNPAPLVKVMMMSRIHNVQDDYLHRVFDILLLHGADPNTNRYNGGSGSSDNPEVIYMKSPPLICAAELPDNYYFQKLLEQPSINVNLIFGDKTAITIAAFFGRTQHVQQLISAGARLTGEYWTYEYGLMNPIQAAMLGKHSTTLEALLMHPDINSEIQNTRFLILFLQSGYTGDNLDALLNCGYEINHDEVILILNDKVLSSKLRGDETLLRLAEEHLGISLSDCLDMVIETGCNSFGSLLLAKGFLHDRKVQDETYRILLEFKSYSNVRKNTLLTLFHYLAENVEIGLNLENIRRLLNVASKCDAAMLDKLYIAIEGGARLDEIEMYFAPENNAIYRTLKNGVVYKWRKALSCAELVITGKTNTNNQGQLLALRAIERIEIPGANDPANLLRMIIKLVDETEYTHENASLILQALSTLASIDVIHHDEKHLGKVLDGLFRLLSINQGISFYALTAFGIIQKYNKFAQLSDDSKYTNHLLKLENSLSTPDMRYQFALTISSIPNRKLLMMSYHIIRQELLGHLNNSTLQQELKRVQNTYIKGKTHNFIRFKVPNEHSPPAVINRILDLLIMMNGTKQGIANDRLNFNPTHQPFWQPARYLAAPLYRGICNRKGAPAFVKAVIDLLERGAGSCELNEAPTDKQTWSKIGFIFSAEDLSVSEPYASDGALMVINPNWANKAIQARKVFMAFNGLEYIFQSTIPLSAIDMIYLEELIYNDIMALYQVGETSFQDFKKPRLSFLHSVKKPALYRLSQTLVRRGEDFINKLQKAEFLGELKNQNNSVTDPHEDDSMNLDELRDRSFDEITRAKYP